MLCRTTRPPMMLSQRFCSASVPYTTAQASALSEARARLVVSVVSLLSGDRAGRGQLLAGIAPDLLEELEAVELVPVLVQAPLADSPDVDRVHLDLPSAGRDAHERAGVASAIGVAANDRLAVLGYVINLDSKVLEGAQEVGEDGDRALLPGSA